MPFRLEPKVAAYLAYELHLQGLGDNAVLSQADWELFGLNREDTLEELKRIGRQGFLIVQAAGGAVKVSWKYQTLEEVCDALTKG